MKKLLLIMIVILSVSILQAAELSVAGGAKLWYMNWDPFFKDLITERAFSTSRTILNSTFEMNSTIMGGPNISLLYGDLGFSTAVSYGQFVCKGSSSYIDGWDNDNTKNKNFIMAITRYDIDLSLSYRLFSQLVAFAGYKIMLLDVDDQNAQHSITNTAISEVVYSIEKFPAQLNGPAVGLGYKFGISNLILGANCSFIYLTGVYGPFENKAYNIGSSHGGPNGMKFNIKSPGYTFEPYIGLQAGDRAIMLLGFRYQYLKSTMTITSGTGDFGTDANGNKILDFDSTDTFLGVSLSISVIF